MRSISRTASQREMRPAIFVEFGPPSHVKQTRSTRRMYCYTTVVLKLYRSNTAVLYCTCLTPLSRAGSIQSRSPGDGVVGRLRFPAAPKRTGTQDDAEQHFECTRWSTQYSAPAASTPEARGATSALPNGESGTKNSQTEKGCRCDEGRRGGEL